MVTEINAKRKSKDLEPEEDPEEAMLIYYSWGLVGFIKCDYAQTYVSLMLLQQVSCLKKVNWVKYV